MNANRTSSRLFLFIFSKVKVQYECLQQTNLPTYLNDWKETLKDGLQAENK